jgi:hypothetical protein
LFKGIHTTGQQQTKSFCLDGKRGLGLPKKTHPKQKAKNEEDKILEILER